MLLKDKHTRQGPIGWMTAKVLLMRVFCVYDDRGRLLSVCRLIGQIEGIKRLASPAKSMNESNLHRGNEMLQIQG